MPKRQVQQRQNLRKSSSIPRVTASALLLLFVSLWGSACSRSRAEDTATDRQAGPQPTPLEAYMLEPDPAYDWQLVHTIEGDGYTGFVLEMTSQSWLTEAEVDRTVWKHWLTIVRPDEVSSEHALLFIGGGDNGDPHPTEANPLLLGPALMTGSVAAELRMVPNQPLSFAGDDFGPRVEDQLIAYGWDKFLRGGPPIWLPRLPMTKAAVRALDTITAFCDGEQAGGLKVDRFVVAGGSKRGWTTWTTAIVDQRVVAIAPLVIDLLNVEPSFRHHYQAYGFYAPAVGDYEREGIMEWQGTPEYRSLMEIVEPYEYRDRLTLPKFLINGASDQFFLPDSWRFYWSDLVGEKHLRYVPNVGHSLQPSDAAESLTAFYHAVISDQPRPDFDWQVSDNLIRVNLAEGAMPTEVKLWSADNSEARDFRLETIARTWISVDLQPGDDGTYEAVLETPESGHRAYFVELTFPGAEGSEVPFKFTTGVKVVPDTLDFDFPSSG